MRSNPMVNGSRQEVDMEFSENLKAAVIEVWDMIAYDVGTVQNRAHAVEMCLDANRLLLLGGNILADAELRALYARHGYSVVIKALSEQVELDAP
jgi:hypothetical protein